VHWLGIPYAHAARFGEPNVLPYDASRAYDAFGPAAPQAVDNPLGGLVPGMRVGATDERNCLTLNIWAPDGAEGLPVLVWFYGGSFVIGASSQPVYDGALLAHEQQVVVVTVNYRLGALGFLDARPIGGLANCGVRDALAALTWLRENIASFGGDPSRVVMWGESAGGGLTLHTLASPRARGLVSGAIVQSGATFSTLDDERAAVVRDTLVKEAGGADLRELAVDDLIAAQGRAMSELLGTVGMMPFHPMVDGDVVTQRPVDGLAVDVPLLIGTTADEMRLFMPPAEPPTRERLESRIARYAKVSDAAALVDAYAADLGTDDTNTIWAAVFSDVEMQLPMRAVVERHAPAYNYLFTWAGPNVGSCHGIDIPFGFGNFVEGWDAFVGGDPSRLSRQMRDAWAAFARTGDPGWTTTPATMILGEASHLATVHPFFARLPRPDNRG
jgi:para-nitrobenzyl esterase